MSDKQHNWFALPKHAVVALQGPDALAFAHAQFMNDLRPLDDSQWQWSGWLSPKRSEEHTSELQSLMRISYAVFCLKKNKKKNTNTTIINKIHDKYVN